MDLVEAFIELQIYYHVYNNRYNCDRDEVIKNLKAMISYLQLLDLSVKIMSCIIDGILEHPVNLGYKPLAHNDLSAVGKKMLELKRVVLREYKKHRGNKTRGRYKKINPTLSKKVA